MKIISRDAMDKMHLVTSVYGTDYPELRSAVNRMNMNEAIEISAHEYTNAYRKNGAMVGKGDIDKKVRKWLRNKVKSASVSTGKACRVQFDDVRTAVVFCVGMLDTD